MKKLLSTLLCALLLLLLLPAPFAGAEGPHRCGGIEFDRPLSGQVSGTLEPGSYYVDGECSLVGHVRIEGEVNLCLNGLPIAVQGSSTFLVCDGGVLSIYDCGGTGLIGYHNTELHNHPLTVERGGTANIYGGWLYGRDGSNAINSHGTVNIYGGKIESGWDYQCAVRNEGVLNLYGGELIGFYGISQRYYAVIKLCGSRFSITGTRKALQYVEEISPLFVETPYYRWRKDPEGPFTDSTDEPFVPVDSDRYVEFAPLTAPIRYETDGGTLAEDTPREYICGEGCVLDAAAERAGYAFLGWYGTAEGGERVTQIPADSLGEIVLYARYEPLPSPSPEPEPEPESESSSEPQEQRGLSRTALLILLAALFALLGVCVGFLVRDGKRR